MLPVQQVFFKVLLVLTTFCSTDYVFYLAVGKSIGAVFFWAPSMTYRPSACARIQCPVYQAQREGRYDHLPYQDQGHRVLIATPVFNGSAGFLQYFSNLCCLSYPRTLISVVILDGADRNSSLFSTDALSEHISRAFRRSHVVALEDLLEEQDMAEELRTANISETGRNMLYRNDRLVEALRLDDADWVLWLDHEISEVPSDIIQRLQSAEQDVVIPSCHGRDEGEDERTPSETEFEKALFVTTQTYKTSTIESTTLYNISVALGNSSLINSTSNKSDDSDGDGIAPWIDLSHLGDRVSPRWTSRNGDCAAFIRADLHKQGPIIPSMMDPYMGNDTDFVILAEVIGISMHFMPSLEVFH